MNILIGQSGGPTPVINASLAGMISKALSQKEIQHIYGAIHGIEGFLEDKYIDLASIMTQEALERLKITPGAYLGSCRYQLPSDLSDPIYPKIFEKFAKLNIGIFLYNGGNDSMDTVSKLSTYAKEHHIDVKCIGIPKTVDNDLMMTDHCPGFASNAKFIANQLQNIIVDTQSYHKPTLTIVEIMGRHTGWLAASSALARMPYSFNPFYIYLPEKAFDLEQFLADIQAALKKQTNLVVCISEGIKDKEGKFISEYASAKTEDSFGHKYLAGAGKFLEDYIRSTLGIKVRSIELNLPQRCSSQFLSKTDLEEAFAVGEYGVEKALEGKTGQMVVIQRLQSFPYQTELGLADVHQICNQEKFVLDTMIHPAGNDITQEFIDYCTPLIQGEVSLPYKNGLVDYLYRDHH